MIERFGQQLLSYRIPRPIVLAITAILYTLLELWDSGAVSAILRTLSWVGWAISVAVLLVPVFFEKATQRDVTPLATLLAMLYTISFILGAAIYRNYSNANKKIQRRKQKIAESNIIAFAVHENASEYTKDGAFDAFFNAGFKFKIDDDGSVQTWDPHAQETLWYKSAYDALCSSCNHYQAMQRGETYERPVILRNYDNEYTVKRGRTL